MTLTIYPIVSTCTIGKDRLSITQESGVCRKNHRTPTCRGIMRHSRLREWVEDVYLILLPEISWSTVQGFSKRHKPTELKKMGKNSSKILGSRKQVSYNYIHIYKKQNLQNVQKLAAWDTLRLAMNGTGDGCGWLKKTTWVRSLSEEVDSKLSFPFTLVGYCFSPTRRLEALLLRT